MIAAPPSSAPTTRPAPTSTARASSPGELRGGVRDFCRSMSSKKYESASLGGPEPGPEAAGLSLRCPRAADRDSERSISRPFSGSVTRRPAARSGSSASSEISAKPPAASERFTPSRLASERSGLQLDADRRQRFGGDGARPGARLAGDPAAAGELARVDRAALRPAVPGGDDEDDAVAGDLLGLEAVERVEALTKPTSARFSRTAAIAAGGVDDVDLRVDAGQLGAEGGQPGGSSASPTCGWRRSAAAARRGRRRPPPRPGAARPGRGALPGRAPSPPRSGARRGGRVCRRVDAEAALERLDPLRRRRLGQVERLGGACTLRVSTAATKAASSREESGSGIPAIPSRWNS